MSATASRPRILGASKGGAIVYIEQYFSGLNSANFFGYDVEFEKQNRSMLKVSLIF